MVLDNTPSILLNLVLEQKGALEYYDLNVLVFLGFFNLSI